MSKIKSSKNYFKKYKGQGRWKKHQVITAQKITKEVVYAKTEHIAESVVMGAYKHKE